jgi:kumamolisin
VSLLEKPSTQRKVKCTPYIKLSAKVNSTWSAPALCAAYGWPKNLPGGGDIAIVELGGGWVQSDVDTYFKSINQPSPSITDVSVDGTLNSKQLPKDGADVEVALDIQVAGAAYFCATGKPAKIFVYWAQDIDSAVAAAAKDGRTVCSISWGADEADWGAENAQAMEAEALAATTLGMTVFAAAGDNDSSDGGPESANVDCPASCPHVVACGGTSKTAATEVVWNDNPGRTNGEGTGGGYSAIFSAQAWQVGVPKPPSTGFWGRLLGKKVPVLGRMLPDISANADPETGYEILVYGQWQIVGGTSAAAPLFAGLFAAIGGKRGFVSPELWANQSAFNDIVSGNNGQYSAAKGPDPCSGVGSPRAAAVAALF